MSVSTIINENFKKEIQPIQKPVSQKIEICDILRDLLPTIFSYLDSKSLSRCFQVCKTWQPIVVKQMKSNCDRLLKEVISLQKQSISLKGELHSLCVNRMKNLEQQPLESVSLTEIKYTFFDRKKEVDEADKACFMKDQELIEAERALKKLVSKASKERIESEK